MKFLNDVVSPDKLERYLEVKKEEFEGEGSQKFDTLHLFGRERYI